MFSRFTRWCAYLVGTPHAFILSLLMVLVWAIAGPFFGFSDTWQLIINTSTTVITFWFVFVIQHTQNEGATVDRGRDEAMHAKLDEIIRSIDEADDELIGIEKTAELDAWDDDGGAHVEAK